jgi:hypothetical protein
MFNVIKEAILFIKENIIKKEVPSFVGGSVCGGIIWFIQIPLRILHNQAVIQYFTTAILAMITGLCTAAGAHLFKWALKKYSTFKPKTNGKRKQERTNGGRDSEAA